MANVKKTSILVFLIAAFLAVGFSVSRPASADNAQQIQSHIDDLMKQQTEAQKELTAQQSSLYKNQAQIAVTRALLNKINADISSKEAELKNLDDQATLNKTMLAEYIRQMYYANQDHDVLVGLALSQGNLSDMMANSDNMLSIKAKIIDSLQIINDAKTQTQQAQATLADQQANHQQVLKTQQVQQAQISSDIQDTQATLQQLNDKLSKLRSDLSAMLGANISTDDINKAAKIASQATGVRKDFILGELVVESDLGRFTGGCTYDKSKMGSANLAIFKSIASSLSYNYKNLKVSCPLSYGIGGAMGIAQFMPSTWVGYESRISSATGHNPPDPWNLVDGVTGMAIKLANDGATSKSGEKNAAARYYCGGNYTRAICQNYAKKVLYWADNYQQLLNN
jgi:peptidoglycan hydrolase CwlO-like protein